MTSAKVLAYDVVSYANERRYKVTNLKLQKMMYYLQGYYAKQFEDALFEDEIVCWPYGPVVPMVYFEFCQFGASEIQIAPVDQPFAGRSHQEKRFLCQIVDACLKLPASVLVEKTHNESPWKMAREREIIPFPSIKAFFSTNDPLEIMTKKVRE